MRPTEIARVFCYKIKGRGKGYRYEFRRAENAATPVPHAVVEAYARL